MKKKQNKQLNKLVVFQNKKIRKTWYKNEWWFCVIDIIETIAETTCAKKYWNNLKIKLKNEGYTELSDKIVQVKLKSLDGKIETTDCANTKTVFRIIQSISSETAELFKRWQAKVGYERIQEIENPEIVLQRMINSYENNGYSKDWINKRLRSMAISQNLMDEWKERGIK